MVSKFKERAEAVQSVVTTIGIITGAAWVLWKFSILEEASKAAKELHKIEAETAQAEFAQLRQRTEWEERQPAVEVSFAKTTIEPGRPPHRTVLATLLLANRGAVPITLEFDEAPFQLTLVEFADSGLQPHVLNGTSILGKSPLRAIVLRPQTSSTLAFAVSVKDVGLYLAEFRARLAKQPDTQWSAHDYVAVR
jgi:hypothetical protein